MIYISALVKSLAESFKALCELLTKTKDKQIETDILKEKNKLKNASDITEEILSLIREYFAVDSQYSNWFGGLFYEWLDSKERKIFEKYGSQKSRIKKKIVKLQKEFERCN